MYWTNADGTQDKRIYRYGLRNCSKKRSFEMHHSTLKLLSKDLCSKAKATGVNSRKYVNVEAADP